MASIDSMFVGALAAPATEQPMLTREIFGNIGPMSKAVFYLLAVASVTCFAFGIYQRVRLWRMGRRSEWRGSFRAMVRRLLERIVLQRAVRGRGWAGVAHMLLFWGFIVLTIGTTLIAIEHFAHDITGRGATDPVFHKGIYYAVFEVVMDTFGLAVLAGCGYFAWRRYKANTSIGHNAGDWVILGTLALLCVSGYMVEGLRIIREQTPMPGFSYVGYGFARLFEAGGVDGHIAAAHWWVWWFHAVAALAFIAAMPYSRLLHVFAGTLNVMTLEKALGRMTPVSMEEVEETGRVGAAGIRDFTDRQLLEMDACVSCGRCEDACPAHEAGKPLSPRDVVQNLRGHLNETAPLLLRDGDGEQEITVHGSVIGAETLWSCTTCSACVQVCPLGVNPLTMITDMRRHLVAEGELRGTAATALQKTQRTGNPWGLPRQDRFAWAADLEVPTVESHRDFDVLYWVGCAASYDRRIQKVARAVVRLLKAAEVNFAVLGPREQCTGEAARRMGDEFLFQELAQANIDTLQRHNVRKIVTHCPHCFNSFKQDYADFGGDFEVVHHSAFLAELIEQGALPRPVTLNGQNVTYHDPCYLARAHHVVDEPRKLISLTISAGDKLREAARHGEQTACCGAGGGRMWFDDEPSQRIGRARMQELLDSGAETVAVACPFCLTMVGDGIRALDDRVQVRDIAELLADALPRQISVELREQER